MPDPYREPVDEAPVVKPTPKSETVAQPQTQEQISVPEKLAEKPQEIPQPSMPSVQSAPQQTQSASGPATPAVASQPGADLKELEKDRQLKTLVDMAFEQGIDKAVDAAKESGNAYLIDELHDILIDKLRQQLIERGKLKEV